jgi:hypothetical protein
MTPNVDSAYRISPLQIAQGKWQAGMTEQNHLASLALTSPEINKTVAMLFSYKYNNPMTLLTGALSKTEYLSNREFRWYLMGESEKTVAVSMAAFDGLPNAGQYNSSFKVGFPEKYFFHKDVLRTDSGNLVRIQEEPYQEGGNWIYTLRLITSDPSMFVIPSDVELGARFSKEFTAIAEYDSGGATTAATPMMFKNHLTTIAKSDAITRSAATDVMVIRIPNQDGSTTDSWTSMKEWNFMKQWYREQERLLMYSRYNADPEGNTQLLSDNNRPVYMGAGIREQIEMGERREYNKLSAEVIMNFLTDLSYQKKDFAQRKFVALTGEMGMMEFHYAMREELKTWNMVPATFTVEGSNMNLTFGNQFKTYKALNGMELTLMHFPLYDDLLLHRTLHKVTLKPQESYRFTVLDFSDQGAGPNIQKVAKKDSENLMWHVAGGFSPFGPAKSLSTMRSSALDGYSVHALTEIGVRIMNPFSCGELVYRP